MTRFDRAMELSKILTTKAKWKGDDVTETDIVLQVTGCDEGFIELYDSSENKYYTFRYVDFVRAVTAEMMRAE